MRQVRTQEAHDQPIRIDEPRKHEVKLDRVAEVIAGEWRLHFETAQDLTHLLLFHTVQFDDNVLAFRFQLNGRFLIVLQAFEVRLYQVIQVEAVAYLHIHHHQTGKAIKVTQSL